MALALLMIAAGVMHFVKPRVYERMVPPWFGNAALIVQLSGAAEIACGMGLLLPPTRRLAAWGLVALLIAVFPANLYMALEPARWKLPRWALWARLPLQPLLVFWAWTLTRPGV